MWCWHCDLKRIKESWHPVSFPCNWPVDHARVNCLSTPGVLYVHFHPFSPSQICPFLSGYLMVCCIPLLFPWRQRFSFIDLLKKNIHDPLISCRPISNFLKANTFSILSNNSGTAVSYYWRVITECLSSQNWNSSSQMNDLRINNDTNHLCSSAKRFVRSFWDRK